MYVYGWSVLRLKAHANGPNNSQHCCVLLGVCGQQCCVRLHGPKSLTGFKLYATSANIVVVPCKRTQQVTTLLGPTMLGVVGRNNVGSVCMGLKALGYLYCLFIQWDLRSQSESTLLTSVGIVTKIRKCHTAY